MELKEKEKLPSSLDNQILQEQLTAFKVLGACSLFYLFSSEKDSKKAAAHRYNLVNEAGY